jgi:hypothetical protein
VQILNKIRAPVNATNLASLQAWALSESGYNSTYGTNLAGPLAFNPLAITDSYGVPTVGAVNSVGVKKFANTQAGVDATVLFWQHGYQGIIDALRSSDPQALFQAVNQSGWCSGCQGGQYPIGLANFLAGGQVQGGGATFKGGGALTPGGGSGSGGSGGSSGQDNGGLFGTCKVTTSSIPFGPNIPTGGFGCYIEKSFVFGGLALGGVVLMGLGLGLVILPGLQKKIPGAAELVGVGALAGKLGALKSVGGKSESLSLTPPEAPTKAVGETLAEKREKRQQELHRARKGKANADARAARAKAREAELRAPTGRQRVAAAGRGQTKAAGPVGSGPARLAYEVPGY